MRAKSPSLNLTSSATFAAAWQSLGTGAFLFSLLLLAMTVLHPEQTPG